MVSSTYCIWTLFTSHLHLYMLSAPGHVVHMSSAGHAELDISSIFFLQVVYSVPDAQHGPELSFNVTGICY